MQRRSRAVRALCFGQGAFYVASGLWPFVSRRSFEAVTGPKTDFWLVRTVGAMFVVVGGVLVAAGRRARVSRDVEDLAVGTAAVIAAIDVWYATRGRISKVYLLDAAAEAGLLAMWARAAPPSRPPRRSRTRERVAESSTH